METSLQLVTHWQSAQSPRPPQHPTKAPGCFSTLWGSSFTNSHWGLSPLLSEPPDHVLTGVGLTLHSNWPSTVPSTGHPGRVQPLLSFLPPAKGPRVFPGPLGGVITREQGKKWWACVSARRQLPAWTIPSGGLCSASVLQTEQVNKIKAVPGCSCTV